MTEKELVETMLERTSETAQLMAEYGEGGPIVDELYNSLFSIMIKANRWLLNYCPLEMTPRTSVMVLVCR